MALWWYKYRLSLGKQRKSTEIVDLVQTQHSLFSFNWIFMRLADYRHKISNEFEFLPDRNIDFRVTCSLVPTPTPPIQPCPEHSLFSFDWIFMKFADNLDRHKNSRRVQILAGSDLNHFGVTVLTLECKQNTFDFVQSVACVIFIQSLWNLQINRTGIKYSKSWKWATLHFLLWSYMPLIAGMLGLRWAIVVPLGNLFC